MKKIICLAIALLSLCSCANGARDGTSVKGKRTTYCSCLEPNPTPNLDAYNFSYADKLDVQINKIRSGQSVLDISGENNKLFFDSYSDFQTFADQLKTKEEYGNYSETIKFFDAVKEESFNEKNLFMTAELSVGSSAFSHTFDGVYLKNNTLYLHAIRSGMDSLPDGMSVDMQVFFECGYFWLNKDISFTSYQLIIDKATKPQPMVIELD